MTNLKNKLSQHDDALMDQLEIDGTFKQQLYQQLTARANATQSTQWWKLLITTLSVSALAAVVIIIGLNNKPLIKQVLLPQQALAEVLKNTVNVDSLTTTLGLPDDGQLHHRNLTYSYMSDPSDPTSDVGTENINLWTDGNNIRQDQVYSSNNPNTTAVPSSVLANAADDTYCAMQKGSDIFCHSITTEQQDNRTFALQQFKNVTSENYITDFAVTPYTEPDGSTGLTVSWATTQPMTYGTISTLTLDSGSGLGQSATSTGSHDGKFWYSAKISDRIFERAGDMYLQVQNDSKPNYSNLEAAVHPTVLEASSIYRVAQSGLAVTPESFDDLGKAAAAMAVSQEIMHGSYSVALEPIVYVLQHMAAFTDPITTTTTTIHDQSVTVLHFLMPTNYSSEASTMVGDPANDAPYYLDLYMNADQTTFLGYSLKQDTTEESSAWFADETISADQANTIFNVASWKQAN